MQIGLVTSSRADWGLLQPLAKSLKDSGDTLVIYATGTHLSPQFGMTGVDILNDGFSFSPVDVMVDSDSPSGISKSMGLTLISFAEEFRRQKLDGVIVLGDRFEICAAVMAAYNARIPIIHCQAGDYTPSSLDDGYRTCISELSSLLFAGTVASYQVLLDKDLNSLYVGSLCCVFPAVTPTKEYDAIMIYHWSPGSTAEELETILQSFSAYEKVLVVGGNGDVGGRMLQALTPYTLTSRFDFVRTLPRKTFLSYLAGSRYIIGNSSCGIIEAPSLRIPTINVGSRQAYRERAKSVLSANSPQEIDLAKQHMVHLSDDAFCNPYAKSTTLEEMVAAIHSMAK